MIIRTEFKILRLLFFFSICLISHSSFAQKNNPNSLNVTSTGSLEFGRFVIQNGGIGTITIDRYGNGTVNETGSIIMLNRPRPIVQFNISTKKGGDNRMVNVMANPIILANTSGSSGSLELSLNFSQSVFSVNKDIDTIVYMGGVLRVDSGDLSGFYSGTVNVIFAYQ